VTYIILSIQKVCFYIYYTESFSGKAGAAVQLSDHKCLVEAHKVSSLQFVLHPACFGRVIFMSF